MSKELRARLERCRASIRLAIEERLREIAVAAGKSRARLQRAAPHEPAHRFYVYEGYRIFYQLDPITRRLVVLELEEVAA